MAAIRTSAEPPQVIAAGRIDLVLVSVDQLLSRDGTGQPVPLGFDDPDDVLHPDRSPLRRRIAQVTSDPTVNPWLLRLAVERRTGTVVGLGNFHDRPDPAGMVEIGYSVLPRHRGQGFGTQIAAGLCAWAAAHLDVRVIRASVSPANRASLAVVERLGFVRVGEQLDPDDGPELVFERSTPDRPDRRS